MQQDNETRITGDEPPNTTTTSINNTTYNSQPLLPHASNRLKEKQRRQNEGRQHQQMLKQPCPKCGRKKGSHVVIKANRPSNKTLQDARGNRISKRIERKKHTPDPGPSKGYWAIKELQATIMTVAEMLPFVTKRYPSLLIRDTDYAKALSAIAIEIWRPWGDERFSKDWLSWLMIGMDASAYGYNAAASKNATEVRMPNGRRRKIKLTPEYIRERFDVIYEQAKDIVTYMPAYIEFNEVLNYIVNNDKVVRTEFVKRLEENKKRILLQRDDTTTDGATVDDISSYEYRYHYIMHYDRELYKRNKKSQGKVRCGPFTESVIRSYF